jgi:dTDP-4-amino-4,6-dideoxygalactose transaminase
MGVRELSEALSGDNFHTSAAIAVDNYGNPCELRELANICRSAGIKLILDACESLGSTRSSPQELNVADLVTFSFSFTKPIHSLGMGGALAVRKSFLPNEDEELNAICMIPHLQLPAINGIYLLMAEPDLFTSIENLNRIYAKYTPLMESLGFRPQKVAPDASSNHIHAVFAESENTGSVSQRKLAKTLEDLDIETRMQFPPQSQIFTGGRNTSLAVTGDLERRLISLPTGSGMINSVLDRVCSAIERMVA